MHHCSFVVAAVAVIAVESAFECETFGKIAAAAAVFGLVVAFETSEGSVASVDSSCLQVVIHQ